jgi:hypothetical protein
MNQNVAAVYVEVILSPLVNTASGDQEELWPPSTKDWASCISSGCIHKMAQLLIMQPVCDAALQHANGMSNYKEQTPAL